MSRGSVYYLPQPASTADLALMRRIDELHLDYPFAGSRMLQGLLNAEGHEVGRLHVRTLMRKMGIEAIYRRPNTSKSAPGHKAYPYLLKNLAITRPNQVWAVEEALSRHGKPEIFNTDQGSQFTSLDFIKLLKAAEISISLDGKEAWRDNVFVERLWRSIKYEEAYFHAYKSVPEVRAGIDRYLAFYNNRRPHSSLDRKTPDQVYLNQPQPISLAA